METWKEIWGDLKGHLSDRLGNPFAGAFLIAWGALNFRLIVVLFWIEPYRDKFKYIDETLYPHLGYWALRAAVLPAVAAYAYLLLYPWFTTKAITYYRRKQAVARNEMRAAAGAALMTHDEHAKALLQLAKAETRWHTEQSDLRAQSARQTELNVELTADLQRLKTELAEERQKAIGKASAIAVPGNPPTFYGGGESIDPAVVTTLRGFREGAKVSALKLSRPHMHVAAAAQDATYTPRQLKILELLRNGEKVSDDTLASSLRVEPFDVKTDIHALSQLRLVAPYRAEWRATDEGLVVLKAFIEEGQWEIGRPL